LKNSESQDSYEIKAVRGRYKKLEQEMNLVQSNVARLKEENSRLYTENESNKFMVQSKMSIIKDLELRNEGLSNSLKSLNLKVATLEDVIQNHE